MTWRLKYEVVLAFAYAKLVELADGKKMIRELEDDLGDIRDEAFRGQEGRNE